MLFYSGDTISAIAAKEWGKVRPYFVRFFYPEKPALGSPGIAREDRYQYDDLVRALRGDAIDPLEALTRQADIDRIGKRNYR